MSQKPQEIMETIMDNSSYNVVETMESEDIGEVQYVYDENQMILGAADDFNNITDLVLEDGTRAMIVNGTLVTADGQTLVLQDGSDLSQYYVDENTDEILLSQEEEEQYLEIISPPNPLPDEEQQVQYVHQGSNNTEHLQDEILYIHEDDQEIHIQEQYRLAEVESENIGVPMQMIKFENQHVIEGMDGVIDLEQFLNQQGLVQLEGGNYHYAVLKEGKFHIQTLNESNNVETLKDQSSSNVNNPVTLESSPELSSLDLSAIRGKNMSTGEPICLSKYMNKAYTRNNKKGNSSKNENSKIKYLDQYKMSNTSAITNVGLKNLINKKITIGKTDKGKLLVGKIINVTKKTDASTTSFKSNKCNLEKNTAIKKKIVLPPKDIKKNINLALKEVISVVDKEDTKIRKPSGEMQVQNENSCARTNNSMIAPVHPIPSNQNEEIILASNCTVTSVLKPVLNAPSIPENECQEIMVEHEDKSLSPTKDKSSQNAESSPEQSKIVVHKRVVTKDCFEVITRTLTGLMNMESVVKKLKNKTVIIKIIEKDYNHDTGNYSKNVSYCTGYMVREYKLNEDVDSFSESWRFIPDTNSQDTILEEDNVETVFKDPPVGQNNLKRIANLTIQIIINPQGSRTTRVIINPPNMYKCRECAKIFRTSSALKVHISDHHSLQSCCFKCVICSIKFENYQELKEHSLMHQVEDNKCFKCVICSIKFENYQELKEHSLMHQVEDNKGMYECMECNKRFGSSLLLRRHMYIHFKPVNCRHCNKSFSNMRDLKKHLPIHEPVVPEPHTVPTILKKCPQDPVTPNATPHEQKIYCCHICGRQFSRHSNLQRHIEIHQGEGAMYKCAICGCSYHYVSSLTRHVVTCHVDTTNRRSQKNVHNQDINQGNTKDNLHFLQEDQIVQMIRLEDISTENLQYVTGTIGHVTENLNLADGVEVLQIPVESVDESNIVIAD